MIFKDKRKLCLALLAGVILAFCYCAGYSLEKADTVDLSNKIFYVYWLLASLLGSVIVSLIWKGLERLSDGFTLKAGWFKVPDKIKDIHMPFWAKVSFLFVCWVPAWLSIFPGAFSYDADAEWLQIATGQITAHHPVLHVLFVGGITEGVGALTGDYNVGIAVCTLLQMLLLAVVFAYVSDYLKEMKVGKAFRCFALLFYAFSPVIQLFAICSTKDVLFAAMALLFQISILRLLEQGDAFWSKPKWQVLFVVSALLAMILRNNGLYIVILSLIMIFVYVKQDRNKLWKLILPIAAVYLIYTGPMYKIMNVQAGGVEEMLSVPIQQIARVHHYEADSIEEGDLELLYQVIPKENWDAYRVSVSDFVKSGFVAEAYEQNKAEFWKIWLKLGVEHPLTYVNSFLLGTVDFWYPHAVMDGYRDVYGKSSYFDYQVCDPGREIVILEGLHEFYEYISLDKSAQQIPGMFLVLSPGWYFVVAFVISMYLWYRRSYGKLIVIMVVGWNMLTVLLGPIALVRYVLPLFYGVALYPILIQKSKKDA